MIHRFFALSLLVAAFTLPAPARANEVPAFTPNVVDTTNTLSAADKAEINATIQAVRERAGIWGAVLIVDRLEGDSLESLAERAFRKWELGQAKVDNGVLLLLSMQERKSRFEIGYGLEGDLPDAVARRALDDVLRPEMKQGKVKEAIIRSFDYLAAVKTKDEAAQTAAVGDASAQQWSGWNPAMNPQRGLATYAFFFVLLWFLPLMVRTRARSLAAKLEGQVLGYSAAADKSLGGAAAAAGLTPIAGKAARFGGYFLRAFLSLNPGAFIFVGAGFSLVAALAIPAVLLLIAYFYARGTLRRYASPEAFSAWMQTQRRRHEARVAKGFMKETSPGHFEYTPAWYASSEYKASRSSSRSGSSRSSSSSSSGGGRSGGGGASSGW